MAKKNIESGGHLRSIPWFGLGFFVLVCATVGIFFTEIPAKVNRNLKQLLESRKPVAEVDERTIAMQIEQRLRAEMEKELARELKQLQEGFEEQGQAEKLSQPRLPLGKVTDVRELRSGIAFKSSVDVQQGGIASVERVDADSYVANYELGLKIPTAATTLVQLQQSNPNLHEILPSLDTLLASGEISPWFDKLYENKIDRVRRNANALNELLTKHNIYDCETILNLRADNGRKVFLMQADMDVVSDGSDGDRLAEMPDEIVNSTYYQPFTSYGWKKRTKTPNPMVAGFKKRIGKAEEEIAKQDTDTARRQWLKDRAVMLKRWISDLEARSYLIAKYDPFIVIPVNLLTARNDAFAPKVGDYAVVIHGETVYPCIVGDGGPTFKVGEASLRMAQQINERASPYSRPVSDLKVTYVVFPGSREEKKGPPNYELWKQKCGELLTEIGGLGDGYQLHDWENLLAQKEDEVAPEVVPVEVIE